MEPLQRRKDRLQWLRFAKFPASSASQDLNCSGTRTVNDKAPPGALAEYVYEKILLGETRARKFISLPNVQRGFSGSSCHAYTFYSVFENLSVIVFWFGSVPKNARVKRISAKRGRIEGAGLVRGRSQKLGENLGDNCLLKGQLIEPTRVIWLSPHATY